MITGAPSGVVSAGWAPESTAAPRIPLRATLSCAASAAARSGAEAEAEAIGTGGPLRFSFGLSESLNNRTASPSSTSATRKP